MSKRVLAVGLDPAFVDFTTMPQFTAEMFRSFIDAQLDRVRSSGYDVTSCLIDLGDTAEAVTARALTSGHFDCVLIGAGLRQPGERLLLFEKIINLVHELAPHARICFNTTPADSVDAVRRWVAAWGRDPTTTSGAVLSSPYIYVSLWPTAPACSFIAPEWRQIAVDSPRISGMRELISRRGVSGTFINH